MLIELLKDTATIGTGPWFSAGEATQTLGTRSFHGGVVAPTSVTVTAVIKIWAANDLRFPILLGTITLNGTQMATDVFADNFPFDSYRAELVSITGLNALASVSVKV